MIKTDFYSKYRISDVKPIDVTRRSISVLDFVSATETFLNDNFRGLCNVNSNVPDGHSTFVIVSSDQTAYFFKVMLSYIRPEKCVDVDVFTDKDILMVKISSSAHLPFSEPDALEIIKLGRRAGFFVKITNESIVLYTQIHVSMRYQVYATSANDMLSKYHSIFFTGIIK